MSSDLQGLRCQGRKKRYGKNSRRNFDSFTRARPYRANDRAWNHADASKTNVSRAVNLAPNGRSTRQKLIYIIVIVVAAPNAQYRTKSSCVYRTGKSPTRNANGRNIYEIRPSYPRSDIFIIVLFYNYTILTAAHDTVVLQVYTSHKTHVQTYGERKKKNKIENETTTAEAVEVGKKNSRSHSVLRR